jgi:aldehyde:ferredoxin oxidoreductase
LLSNMTSGELSKLLSLATGWELTPRTLVEVGSRSFTLKRLINNAFGAGARLPVLYATSPLGQGFSG